MSDRITVEPYAAIRELHAPSDAVLAMRHERRFEPEDVPHIDI